MKKFNLIAASLAAFATIFSCNPTGTDEPGTEPGKEPEKEEVKFSLTDANIAIDGLDYDYIVEVDNAAKTVDIYIDYLDKENAQALSVDFKGLEEGVTVAYSKVYNYVAGSQTVVFTKSETTFSYVFSVVAGKPSPKFIDLTIGGVSVSGTTVKFPGGTDLKALAVEYTVSPSDTKVFVGDTELQSGTEVDFSDKVNGVTFSLRCAEVTAEVNVKAQTTGISTATRVWGHYVKPTTVSDDWFGTKVTGTLDCIRNVALNDEYVFMSKDLEKEVASAGVYAVKLLDPDDVTLMSSNGIGATERFFGITVLENTPIAVTFVMAAGATLRIYKWDTVSSDPTVALEYTLPAAMRLGDKIAAYGTWENGEIWLYDNTSAQKILRFDVKGGKIAVAPSIIDFTAKMGNYGTFYKYADGQYVWGGNAAATFFEVSGTTATSKFSFPTASYAAPCHGIQFFTFNEEDYMGYVVLRNAFTDGQFRISPLRGATLQESIEAASAPYAYWLGDPEKREDNAGNKNGNGLGSGMYRVVDGHHYYVAYVPGTGISLFEIK